MSPDVMRGQLPSGIEPDLYGGSAFLSIVIAEIERMRPVGLPWWTGLSFDQVVYRVVVNVRGERGVFFWRSDANNSLVCTLGNAMSFFRFHACRLKISESAGQLEVDLRSDQGTADIRARFDLRSTAPPAMPMSSRFSDLPEATDFLVNLYSAFARPDAVGPPIRVPIRRGPWNVKVVDDLERKYAILQKGRVFNVSNARFDSAFFVRDVRYEWGRPERLG